MRSEAGARRAWFGERARPRRPARAAERRQSRCQVERRTSQRLARSGYPGTGHTRPATTRRRSRSFHPWCEPRSCPSRTPPPSSPRRSDSTCGARCQPPPASRRAANNPRPRPRRRRRAFARRRALGRGSPGALPALLRQVQLGRPGTTATCAKFEEYLDLAGAPTSASACSSTSTLRAARGEARAARGARRRGIQRPVIGVAFNPFLTDQMSERSRLRRKLATGHVSSVWLQLGSDVAQLDDALAFLGELKRERECRSCASTVRSSCRRASSWRR